MTFCCDCAVPVYCEACYNAQMNGFEWSEHVYDYVAKTDEADMIDMKEINYERCVDDVVDCMLIGAYKCYLYLKGKQDPMAKSIKDKYVAVRMEQYTYDLLYGLKTDEMKFNYEDKYIL